MLSEIKISQGIILNWKVDKQANAKDRILNNYKVLSKPSKAIADIVLGKSEAKKLAQFI